MSSITPFHFENIEVRVVTSDGEPWFVANDVCAVLGISDARQALEKLDDDERGGCSVPTPSGTQKMRIINESGLYTLILRSRGATTTGTIPHRFRKWVTAEVLPSIRKTGAYSVAQAPINLSDTADNDNLKLRKVRTVRDIFGNKAARQTWLKLGLETVPAMFEGSAQMSLFSYTAVKKSSDDDLF